MIECRKIFINNFNYNIINNYIDNHIDLKIPPKHISLQTIMNLLFIIDKKYDLNLNLPFQKFKNSITFGYCYIYEHNKDKYYDDIITLEFKNFYSTLYYQNYINGHINYNKGIFLLYSLLYQYRINCNSDSVYYNISKIFLNSYYYVISTCGFIEKNLPNIFFNRIM
jgi:hypothetical protein